MKRFFYAVRVITAAAITGIATVSGFLDLKERWGPITDRMLAWMGAAPGSEPTLYRLVYNGSLFIVSALCGWAAIWALQIGERWWNPPASEGEKLKEAEGEGKLVGTPPPSLWRVIHSLNQLWSRHPRWILTFVGTIIALFVLSADQSAPVTVVLGTIFLILSSATTISFFTSLVHKHQGDIETWALAAFFSVVCFAGLLAFQVDNVATIADTLSSVPITMVPARPPAGGQPTLVPTPTTHIYASTATPVSVSTTGPGVQPSEIVESFNQMFPVDKPSDAVMSGFVFFAGLFGLVGLVGSRNNRLAGLIVGVLLGGAFGLLLGSITGAITSVGAWLGR